MKTWIIGLVLILLTGAGCSRKPDPHLPWYPHYATAWRTTPGGFTRDAGPFDSVAAGYTNDDEIDAAIDAGYTHFYTKFPQFTWVNVLVSINDDYTMWAPLARQWVAGFSYGPGSTMLWVALWRRVETIDEPGDCWIKRAPGEYWDVYYPNWRHTGRPLAPALAHELLHIAIGDPQHTRAEWATLNSK